MSTKPRPLHICCSVEAARGDLRTVPPLWPSTGSINKLVFLFLFCNNSFCLQVSQIKSIHPWQLNNWYPVHVGLTFLLIFFNKWLSLKGTNYFGANQENTTKCNDKPALNQISADVFNLLFKYCSSVLYFLMLIFPFQD